MSHSQNWLNLEAIGLCAHAVHLDLDNTHDFDVCTLWMPEPPTLVHKRWLPARAFGSWSCEGILMELKHLN